jgi:maltose alpha-D-glucosyltransferase/alpha-amylase
MGDDLTLPERNCARTPMQWSTEPQAGFTLSDKPFVPVISDGPYGFSHVNVAEQRRDPNSLLNWTERVIRMRKEVPEIGLGRLTVEDTGSVHVLACRYDWRNNAVLFLHNLAGDPVEIKLRTGPKAEKGQNLINLLSGDHSQADAKGIHVIRLEAYGYRWYRIGGLDYLLRRTDV